MTQAPFRSIILGKSCQRKRRGKEGYSETMFTTRRIKNKFGDNICRRCINRQYRVNLTHKDCRYGYQYICPRCKSPRNIVVAFTLSGHLKMLFR